MKNSTEHYENERVAMQHPVVCLFAHNEEKSIRQTVLSVLEGNREFSLQVKVYLNGCTDRSLEIVEELAAEYKGVEAVVIEEASKVKAWNRAFADNKEEILFFGDGDILQEKGAVSEILEIFEKEPDVEFVCCTTTPVGSGLHWQQKIVGLLQMPLRQDFLTGHFYGLRRQQFLVHFQELGLKGIPEGIVGDDAFLDRLVSRNRFRLAQTRVFYEPPVFDDYFRYLGRLRWQNEQIDNFFHKAHPEQMQVKVVGSVRIIGKIGQGGSLFQLLLGGSMTALRILVKKIFAKKINAAYESLGPIVEDGSWILSKATRSDSVK